MGQRERLVGGDHADDHQAAPTQPGAGSQTAAAGGGTTAGAAPNAAPGGGGAGSLLGLPPIHHLFLIVMSDQGFGQTFAPGSSDSYMSQTLAHQGELIEDYYAVAGSELANRIALISGQGPTRQIAANCPSFAPITPGPSTPLVRSSALDACTRRVETLVGELTVAHHTWKAYVEGIDKGPHGQPTSCRHPKLGTRTDAQQPGPHDPYVIWSNPFVFFSSLTSQKACEKDDVGLDKLSADVRSAKTAPTFAYITPGACDNGSDTPCSPTAPAGPQRADTFLKTVVPMIEKSAAYKDNALIAITFDESPQTGAHADPSACCNTPAYPNMPAGTALARRPSCRR